MAVLRTHDHAFASRVQSAMTDILFYGSTDMVFSPYGDHWRQIRKIVATHLLSSKKIGSYRLAREKEVQHAMARIREATARNTAVDLSKLLSSFTTDIICHALSGKSLRSRWSKRVVPRAGRATSMLIGGFNLEDYFLKLARLDVVRRMVCARAERIKKKWDDLLDEIIDDHAKNTMLDHEINQDGEAGFIDVLLSIQQEYNLTRENVKGVLVSLLFQSLALQNPKPNASHVFLRCFPAEPQRAGHGEALPHKLRVVAYAQITPQLSGVGVFAYVDDTSPELAKFLIAKDKDDKETAEPNPLHPIWVRKDQQVLGYLLNNLTKEKGNQSVATYFTFMCGLADELAAAGKPIQDDELISYPLHGLDMDYQPLFFALDARVTPIILDELYAMRSNFDQRVAYFHNSSSGFKSSANTRN
ncbi:Cytochrome P450 71C1 [Hordeum vulgare]|nr:Cytochrome P450 71C1 [Hordeum vulgare]